MLPFQAPQLDKRDFSKYKPMFGLYLDIQKQLAMEELSEREVRGRWKSFIGRWVQEYAASQIIANSRRPDSPHHREDDTEDDEVGPAQPRGGVLGEKKGRKSGPLIPNVQDLQLKRELEAEDAVFQLQDIRHARKLDRLQQKEHLDELAPHAEAGTKDRQLEKKRELADSNRAFAASKTEVGGIADVPESDLLGEDDGIEGFKRQKKEEERKKNEREIRREEILRARREEREERIRAHKAKEEKTMSGLIALAKASGEGDPKGQNPQEQGPNPSESQEHPGPPSPNTAEGGQKTKQTTSSKNSSSENSGGPQPKIYNEKIPDTESEDVRKHNEDVSKRYDRPNAEVDGKGETVEKGFWKVNVT
ncbi:MAG: hypothetical protein Q9167_002781 [Letrouitia subvulpina]